MNSARVDARHRLPREPYPGLRPFLDFEAALLFGRERQVREVIEHLRQTQFVAVLGGSGSGKSSLIHAGVVPELRSFGIPGAGDLWLTLTCTPGTNVSDEDSAARRHSPVTRLARRFAALLRSGASAEADAQREHEIAEVFRQEAGFARLLDTYGSELDLAPGPDVAEARVLFVVDQFEEIFHPTNKGVADASLLVERVLDHFFNPHPRCHVVLTMRSEHLNDCAAFLELPDAINKSSYLVRRLDDDELRSAIVGPAQRFLRLAARSQSAAEGTAPPLPAEVRFEPALLQRLLRDVKAIAHDPDHLPLLQHLLARLWEAALARQALDIAVPGEITELDLRHAVAGPAPAAGAAALEEGSNTLRACVENWPEALYKGRDLVQQAQLDALFSRLAYKDPNTGMYTQQRVEVDAVAALLGPGSTRADLRALLSEDFLGAVDYLYWDGEDPNRVTLKVSHESFIRGWSRFRALVDRESESFDEFVGVLRRCAAWAAAGRSDDLLLEAGELRLLRESDFVARLAAPGQHEAWFRFLQLDRDGGRLGRLRPELDDYLQLSLLRLRVRQRSARRRLRWLWLSGLSVLLLPPAFFSFYIQGPVTERAELLLDAGTRANRAPLTPDYPGVGAASAPLASLSRAAELIDEARTGQSTRMTRFSHWLIAHLSWLPPVRRQGAFLEGLTAQTEPPVNGKLRQVLTGAVWHTAARSADTPAFARPDELYLSCVPDTGVSESTAGLQGRLFVSAFRLKESPLRRGLFVPAWTGEHDTTIMLRSATYDEHSGACRYGQIVTSVPLYLDPSIVVDATLRQVAYTTAGPNVEVPAVTVLELDWDRVEDGSSQVLQAQTRAVVTGTRALQRVQQVAGAERVAVVESWRLPGGRALALFGQPWRLVSPGALRLPVAADDPRFEPLQPAPEKSPCAEMVVGWPPQPGFSAQVFVQGRHCFHVARGNPPGPGETTGAAPREQVLVAVYDAPEADQLQRLVSNPPAPLASLAPFARLGHGDGQWLVGVRGDYAGWLAVRGNDANGRPRLLGLPWSTCALWRLAQPLRDAGPGPAPRKAVDKGPDAELCHGR